MSVTLMGRVWTLNLQPPEQSVLLVFADYADDDGRNSYPSVGLVAWKTGYSRRYVQRTVARLRDRGLMEVNEEGGGRYSTRYRLRLDSGEIKTPYQRLRGGRPTFTRGAQVAPARVPRSPHPSVEPSVELPSVVDLDLVVRTKNLRTKSSTRGDGEVGAVVDAFRAIPGVMASRKDGGVLAGLVGKYGAAAVRRVLDAEGPSIAAADNPLLYLASPKRFRPLGKVPGETMDERAKRYAGYARGEGR